MTAWFAEERVNIASGANELEGGVRRGEGGLTVVVMHPHPQYGGDMDNHVVVALCRAFAEEFDATTLRFNFRGAGRSSGVYDGGRGEVDDAIGAAAFAREQRPEGRLLMAGYSFGATVAAAAAARLEAGGVLLVSPPVPAAGRMTVPEGMPALVVTGERDAISMPGRLAELARDGLVLRTVEGADHSWWPGVEVLARECVSWARTLVVE